MANCSATQFADATAIRLGNFLDCQSRLLGEAGYQAMAADLVTTGVVTGLITLFVALIGYRLLLGHSPNLQDGVSWAMRLGFTLALATTWPAFQTVVYRVAVDGPAQVAEVIAAGADIASGAIDTRIQQAYDTIRMGNSRPHRKAPEGDEGRRGEGMPDESLARLQAHQFAPPMPRTATAFLLVTIGVPGALKLAIGFLLAIGPLLLLGLLFASTTGLVVGWCRTLLGLALALTAALLVSPITLVLVEGELVRLNSLEMMIAGDAADPTALFAIILFLGLVMLVVAVAASKAVSALDWQRLGSSVHGGFSLGLNDQPDLWPAKSVSLPDANASPAAETTDNQRMTSIANALSRAARRDNSRTGHTSGAVFPDRSIALSDASTRDAQWDGTAPLGLTGRRGAGRQTQSARKRELRR